MFVDEDKGYFVGQEALRNAPRENRQTGLLCDAEPHIGAEVRIDGVRAGKVTAGAFSPYLKRGVGIALMDAAGFTPGTSVSIGCIDGEYHPGSLETLPLYDKAGEIQRGKRVDIPQRS